MSDEHEARRGLGTGLRCSHCSRPVHETLHTRESWNVDFYAMHTGEVEPATIAREPDGELLTYYKLVSREELVTCVDCYRDPRIRGEREEHFRAERRFEEVE